MELLSRTGAQRHLGKFYFYDDARLTRSAVNYLISEQKPDPIAASGIYLELLERDSASPDRWCDLGDALLSAGQMQKAERSFKRAVQLGPNIPKIVREPGAFYFQTGKYSESLFYFGRILTLDSEFDAIVRALVRDGVVAIHGRKVALAQ